MPFLLVPAAAAGYMYYKKRKEEEAARNGEQVGDTGDENSSHDGAQVIERSDSDCTEIDTNPMSSTSTGATKPMGPMGKFFKFCENLEKEYEKAQERNKLQALDAMKKQREASNANLQTKIHTFSETSIENSKIQGSIPANVVSARPRITTE